MDARDETKPDTELNDVSDAVEGESDGIDFVTLGMFIIGKRLPPYLTYLLLFLWKDNYTSPSIKTVSSFFFLSSFFPPSSPFRLITEMPQPSQVGCASRQHYLD